MTAPDGDVRRLRLSDPPPARSAAAAPGAAAFVGKVTTAVAPAGTFMLVNPVAVLGAEAEGAPATLAVDAGTSVAVMHLGPKSAVRDDLVVCRMDGHRWVSESSLPNAGVYKVCPQVVRCDDAGPPPGSTVTVTNASGFTASCTLSVIRCCVTVPGPGTYTVTENVTGVSQVVTVVAGTFFTFLNFCLGGLGSVKGTVIPSSRVCATGLRVPTTVTAKRGGVVVGSGVTDATGNFNFCYGGPRGADLTVAVDSPPARMAPGSVTVRAGPSSALDLCTTLDVGRILLPAAAGFAYPPCWCLDPASGGAYECQTPLAEHLTFQTPDGPVTLTAGETGALGEGVWSGTRSVTVRYNPYDPCLACAPPSVDAYFQFGGFVPFGPSASPIGCTVSIFVEQQRLNCAGGAVCWGGPITDDPLLGRGGGAGGPCTRPIPWSSTVLCIVDSCAPGFLVTMTGGHDVWGRGAVFTMPLSE